MSCIEHLESHFSLIYLLGVSFVRNLSPQSLQILGTVYDFSLAELQRGFDDSRLGASTRFDEMGSCKLVNLCGLN